MSKGTNAGMADGLTRATAFYMALWWPCSTS